MTKIKEERATPTPVAILLGLLVGITLTYLAVTIGVLVHPWLVDSLGLAGAITTEILVGLNIYNLMGE